jgi:hypothetical protein
MSADTQVGSLGGQEVKRADRYEWKLGVTCTFFILWLAVCVGSLVVLVCYQQIFATHKSWALSALVAGLGGLIGGLARTLNFFSFDFYAFNHRLRTHKSSLWALSVRPKLDDEFDPLWVWYLWCLQPAVGAMVGLVSALAIELGLISLGAGDAAKADINLRLLVLGGIGGAFSESVFQRIGSRVERS